MAADYEAFLSQYHKPSGATRQQAWGAVWVETEQQSSAHPALAVAKGRKKRRFLTIQEASFA